MHVPINSFKFFGMELDVYKHSDNPSENRQLESNYLSGYHEVVITITEAHQFINPSELRVLIVSPIDGRQTFMSEGDIFAMTLAPFERFTGLYHNINYDFPVEGALGADFLDIITHDALRKERRETLVIRHSKGCIIPQSMLFN